MGQEIWLRLDLYIFRREDILLESVPVDLVRLQEKQQKVSVKNRQIFMEFRNRTELVVEIAV